MRRGGRGFGHGCGSGHGRGGRFRDDGDESGRRRRMFDSGELRLVLLKLIADEPRHGYDLIRQVEELTSGAYAPSPGVISSEERRVGKECVSTCRSRWAADN